MNFGSNLFLTFYCTLLIIWSTQTVIAQASGGGSISTNTKTKVFSGVYPHLAYYNDEGECGTGAIVPWADRLWVITYGPSNPFGSSDKLYEITPDLQQIVRPESKGGTHANRMVHKETNQLFIGTYAIDAQRNVRVIPFKEAPGRYTGWARHLSDPANKLYLAAMEEGFYEVDVNTLKTKTLYEDGSITRVNGMLQPDLLLPGAHGKGAYSGQGVMVYSNNGEISHEALKQFDVEAGVLAEWNGKDWKVVRRNQFVEVTGPGGIYGNPNPETDPIWATGWDHKSVIMAVRDKGKWFFYRLPKASHSYDGAHGWNTEWPRIRDVGTPLNPDYLMTMHGMFWKFPKTFSSGNSAGIRPRSAYLKVLGDYTRWNDQLVFGSDDAAKLEFLNKRKIKGNVGGAGQSNSNLWFTSLTQPDNLGPTTAEGAVWLNETVKAAEYSEPFLFAGWDKRSVWIHHTGKQAVTITFETDIAGNGQFKPFRSVTVKPGESSEISFPSSEKGEWIRAASNLATTLTIQFTYTGSELRNKRPDELFKGLAGAGSEMTQNGLLYPLGNNRRALGIAAYTQTKTAKSIPEYYELNQDMKLQPANDPATLKFIQEKYAIPKQVVSIEESSVLVVDDAGRRWRLPLGEEAFTEQTNAGSFRIAREVATERDLLNLHGTFYELPAENADGFAKVRPIASHSYQISDFASYRGMMVLTGIDPKAAVNNPQIIRSEDGKASVWAGVIDDLWKLGKPVGKGGPWKNAHVQAGIPSDPYLIGFYDKKQVSLSHDSKESVRFLMEVEPVGHGPWMKYKEVIVAPGKTVNFTFPADFQARWIRFSTDKAARVSTWLTYQ